MRCWTTKNIIKVKEKIRNYDENIEEFSKKNNQDGEQSRIEMV